MVSEAEVASHHKVRTMLAEAIISKEVTWMVLPAAGVHTANPVWVVLGSTCLFTRGAGLTMTTWAFKSPARGCTTVTGLVIEATAVRVSAGFKRVLNATSILSTSVLTAASVASVEAPLGSGSVAAETGWVAGKFVTATLCVAGKLVTWVFWVPSS